MLDEGLEADPHGASSRAAARVIEAAGRAGIEPSLKLTAAFSDGETLYAIRYASDGNAPTLYTAETRHAAGRCIVSEPYDRDGGDWQRHPAGKFRHHRQGLDDDPALCARGCAAGIGRLRRTELGTGHFRSTAPARRWY